MTETANEHTPPPLAKPLEAHSPHELSMLLGIHKELAELVIMWAKGEGREDVQDENGDPPSE